MSAQRDISDYDQLPEAELVGLAKAGQGEAFRVLMQRCNQRLFRTARSIVRDEAEAEDVLQEAYARAYAALPGFRGEAGVLTWFTQITINEARGRLRKRRDTVELAQVEAAQARAGLIVAFPGGDPLMDPEREAARAEARRLLEHAVDQLPEPFRLVFILREIEECSVEETAASLGLRPQTVKTRLHRARRLLREKLHEQLELAVTEAFPFLGGRCERITAAVLERLRLVANDSPAQPAG